MIQIQPLAIHPIVKVKPDKGNNQQQKKKQENHQEKPRQQKEVQENDPSTTQHIDEII